MNIVLNEATETVHKPEAATEPNTACGVSRTLGADRLRVLPLREATAEYDISRCGRCFEDAGGY